MIEIILRRRSIRKYIAGKDISDEQLKVILKAGMAAPSAGNQQPWHFIVIRERKILDEIPKFHPHALMVLEAPLAIAVCADLVLEKHVGYWVQDCSAAVENMLLAVEALRLGAVWLGVYPREDRVAGAQKLLNLPNKVIPLAIIPIGYPVENKPKEDRFKPERVHQNKW